MAWPTTPLTTYLPASLPAIKSADLNAIQSAINRGFLGTYSYAGIVIDGTGGQDATPVAGGLKTSGPIVAGGAVTIGGAAFGKSLPTPIPVPGAIYSDTRIIAAGFFYANATMYGGFNIASIARFPNIATGTFLIGLSVTSGAQMLVPVANGTSNCIAQATMQDGKTIRVDVFNLQGTPIDQPFNLIVVGG
jgi:hypothetical protein